MPARYWLAWIATLAVVALLMWYRVPLGIW